MAYLSLRNVGKIYVSATNVAVGIRGATLDFELGEFVAVTGKSGSGKSTLLNVISGMDTYEEGELLIEGNATSHYLQKDWEAFREKYISFIFQDYNIIESFTVLENVELALMHIKDKKERRQRARELLTRVGLSSHLKHKGSRLSGGQKQRVVIARALAKDSPILLADEPTGNLDSQSAKEIVELLYEISKEKLVIVVTHNFDQLEGYATRHIRVFDGAIERDLTLSPRRTEKTTYPAHEIASENTKKDIRNGALLGKSIFFSRPRLSLFLCILMILGTVALFAVTGFSGDAFTVFEPHYMFTPMEGRVILTASDGRPLTESELSALSQKYGATSYLHFDTLLDSASELFIPNGDWGEWLDVRMTYGKKENAEIVGRYPEKPGEILLCLPLQYQPLLGKEAILTQYVEIDSTVYEVVGVTYEVDNNLMAECYLSDEGYRLALAAQVFEELSGNVQTTLILTEEDGMRTHYGFGDPVLSFAVEKGKVYCGAFFDYFDKNVNTVSSEFLISAYDPYSGDNRQYEAKGGGEVFMQTKPDLSSYQDFPFRYDPASTVYISPYFVADMVEKTLGESYRQASFFFESDEDAERAVEGLLAEGYRAVTSYATYTPDPFSVIGEVLGSITMLFFFVAFVVFLAFFISLCSDRALLAFKGDMAIMRSMGISVKVIRIAMYFRMLIATVPGFIATGVLAFLVYTSPRINAIFTYLYAWQYALIFVGMLILVWRVTRRQIARLFSESVKKALKGGEGA